MSNIVAAVDEAIIELTDEVDATGYELALSFEDNEIRIQHINEFGVLSNLVLDAAGAYEYAHRILRGYDKLEGI